MLTRHNCTTMKKKKNISEPHAMVICCRTSVSVPLLLATLKFFQHRVSEGVLVKGRIGKRKRDKGRKRDKDKVKRGPRYGYKNRESDTKVRPPCTTALICWIPTPNIKDGVDSLSGRLPEESRTPIWEAATIEDRGERKRGRAEAVSTAIRAPKCWLLRCVSAGAPALPTTEIQHQKNYKEAQ